MSLATLSSGAEAYRCSLCARPLPDAALNRRGTPWAWVHTTCYGPVHVECLRILRDAEPCPPPERDG